MIKHIPNIITLSNLFFGIVGITYVLEGFYEEAFLMMILAAVADFLDGFVARLLKVSGKLGAQLDSLADGVTFGVLPALFMFQMLKAETDLVWLPYFAFAIALFSILRLAIFNISDDQTDNFVGVPTPINAVAIASLSLLEFDFLKNEWLLVSIALVCSLLLVSNIQLLALKFKSFGFQENRAKYLFLLISIILVFTLKIAAIPVILLSYIIISIVHFKLKLI